MKPLTSNQIQVLRDLFNDNAMIYIESKENNILRSDEEFTDHVDNIMICFKYLLSEAEDEQYAFEDAILLLIKLLNKIEAIRNTYDRYSYAYPVFNSFYDRTREGYVEFSKTI